MGVRTLQGYRKVLAERQYELLTPVERLALMIAAEARGDERERALLMQSAPRERVSVAHCYYHSRALLVVLLQDRAELLELLPEFVAAEELDPERDEDAERACGVADTFAYLVLARALGLRLFLTGLGLTEAVVDALLAAIPARDGWAKGVDRAARRGGLEPASEPHTTAALRSAAAALEPAARATVGRLASGEPAPLLTAESHAALLDGGFAMVTKDM